MGFARSFHRFLSLVLLFLTGYVLTYVDSLNERKYTQGQPTKDFESVQTDEFCENNSHNTPQCSRMNENYLKFYCSVFATIAWGGAVRTVLKTFDLSIPYTVVLLITGCILGLGSRINQGFCEGWSQYTKFARTPPDLILYIFLPVLIFESAFNMKSHVFFSNLISISTVALPGMLISVLITALGTQQFFTAYEWTFAQAGLFGAIISATDPVAVVAILHELGTSENLSVMIEGESLLNDGVAILLYDILKEIVEDPLGDAGTLKNVLIKFVRIAIGGPLFGWFMGKVAIFCLTLIFNDAATEITITLVAAYMTYFVGEFYLHVSGVMAVVMLGVVINAGSTAISPEVEHVMKLFWEMMSFLANTVLFVILGIVITETAINSFEKQDGVYLIILYIFLNVVRFLMLFLLSLILHKVGYDTSFNNLVVMTWGGLRGAVGVCLGLQVFKSKEICQDFNVGPKILLQTAGIVLLTLLVNGSTTKGLLDYLGVTALSSGKLHDMEHAVQSLTATRVHTILGLQHDRFLYDANWDRVNKFTHIKDPYAKRQPVKKGEDEPELAEIQATTRAGSNLMAIEGEQNMPMPPPPPPEPLPLPKEKVVEEPDSEAETEHDHDHDDMMRQKSHPHFQLNDEDMDETQTTNLEFNKLMEESRIKVLKAMKISCWTQYEKGSLSEEAVKVLVLDLEKKEEEQLEMIHVAELRPHWEVTGFPGWLQKKVDSLKETEELPPKPKAKWRYPFWWLTTRTWFNMIIYVVVFLNLAPIIFDLILLAQDREPEPNWEETFLFVCVMVFPSIYLLEFLLKVIGRGVNDYCSSRWNIMDFFVMILGLIEMPVAIMFHRQNVERTTHETSTLAIVKVFRAVRLFKLARWARPILPMLNRIVESRVNSRMFQGVNVATGYITAVEDALRLLPAIISNHEIRRKFRNLLDVERMQMAKELLNLQMSHPGVCVAVKTRFASRAISGYMKEELETMKMEGLLEENENEILNEKIDGNLKRLWATPYKLKGIQTESLIDNIAWGAGHNREILGYFHTKAVSKTLPAGTKIYKVGVPQNGIHLIVSGIVKIMYEPRRNVIERFMEQGIFPNVEIYMDLSFTQTQGDYMGIGGVIGEYGSLTKLPRSASVICETEVELIHWPQEDVDFALDHFDDPLDSMRARLWRSWGIRMATELLHCTQQFASWSGDKIRAHLEQGVVPIGPEFTDEIEIPEYIQETILLTGVVVNESGDELIAPVLIPDNKNWSKITKKRGTQGVPRVLLIPHEEDLEMLDELSEQTNLEKLILNAPGVYMSLKENESEHNFLLSNKIRRKSRSIAGGGRLSGDIAKKKRISHSIDQSMKGLKRRASHAPTTLSTDHRHSRN